MTIKQKLLAALNIMLDDISEERLIDILLDNYKEKTQRIEELAGENAHEKFMLQEEWEKIKREHHRMLRDPTYLSSGEYHFCHEGRHFCVDIRHGRVVLWERRNTTQVLAHPLSPEVARKLS
jgi:hypothetical protein